MRHQRLIAALATLGSAVGIGAIAQAPLAAAAGSSVVQASSPLAKPSDSAGITPASTPIEFSVGITPADQSGAEALAQAVSTPGSSSYRQFLTPAQWEKRFSPSQASVNAVKSWLREAGITVEGVSADRLTIEASASAATVQRAFGTSLGQYKHRGKVLRLASSALSVPASVAGLISGVSGIDQKLSTPDHVREGAEPGSRTKRAAAPAKKQKEEIPQPEGFRNATPCSTYYGEKQDTIDPAFGAGYPATLPYSPCGYTPPQLQSAYDLSGPIAGGVNGSGVTVAVVDAYASPTLLTDAQEYANKNQPTQPLDSGQFSELVSPKFNEVEECEANEWYGEQTLDVEAVHATAPGAKLLYVGAKNCGNALFKSVQEVVDGHLADVITDSWGDDGGDLVDSPGTRRAFDNVLMMAIDTGIGVQFSSGDEGDEFFNFGADVAGYPPSSPYQTAVGGTSAQIGASGERLGELGWSTSKGTLCTAELAAEKECPKGKVGKYIPKAPGEYLYGSGGGTSFNYPEPVWEEGVVPPALAERNSSLTGIRNRVEPDISMDADPTTGMLVGETQTFPEGVHYDQYRIGGTSLSSPLFAGVMADADQAAGGPLGFINPLLYKLARDDSSVFFDVTPQPLQALVRSDYLDGIDPEEGFLTSVRTLEYEGKIKFCAANGHCSKEKNSINTAPGYDSMTGIGAPDDGLIEALAANKPQ
jgi:subtilase family serine protease